MRREAFEIGAVPAAGTRGRQEKSAAQAALILIETTETVSFKNVSVSLPAPFKRGRSCPHVTRNLYVPS